MALRKSRALWVNRPPDPASPLPAAAVVKILSVTYNAMGISPEMWTRLARDITASVDRARDYALPMAERRYMAHSVFCGRLWYLAQVVVPPRSFTRQVRSSLFRFFWMNKTELVTRQVLSLPREKGGWGFPCVDGTPALLQLKTMLMILHEAENPARSLALYFVGHSRRDLGVDLTGPSGACAETPPPAYWKALQLYRRLVEQAPQLDITTTPASRLAQALLEPQLTPVQIGLSDSFPWVRLTSSNLPGHLRDFEWQRGWGVLPTRDRLLRWGVCRTDQCPNCDARETNVHVVSECVVTRPFWRVVRSSFRGLGVALYLLRGRCPSGLFACLLLAASEYVLWRNRCCAVGQGRRLRALWPLLFRLRRELVSHLEAQLFLLGEQEFLRRWSCRYLHVHNSRIELRFQYV
ncbi:uncharacterized protein LOC120843272, partial [Ixodes scapularis]|uniref:uncharacterized protein LOC120843272 n=1 Tax=Ixodes scapularis TaxID=6945 RepID=UPI001C390B6D